MVPHKLIQLTNYENLDINNQNHRPVQPSVTMFGGGGSGGGGGGDNPFAQSTSAGMFGSTGGGGMFGSGAPPAPPPPTGNPAGPSLANTNFGSEAARNQFIQNAQATAHAERTREYETVDDAEVVNIAGWQAPTTLQVKAEYTQARDVVYVYKQRCKLYRFDRDSRTWKERAIGDMKIRWEGFVFVWSGGKRGRGRRLVCYRFSYGGQWKIEGGGIILKMISVPQFRSRSSSRVCCQPAVRRKNCEMCGWGLGVR